MTGLTDVPLRLLAVSFFALWLAAWLGAAAFQRFRAEAAEMHEDFGVVQAATLTLLGLIIGFTFSMALTRYDQRKNFEEEEANAIGTEYLRADLLPAADATKVRSLLRQYLEQRVLFYTAHDDEQLAPIDAATGKLQAELWNAVVPPASAQPTPLSALVVAGMNDVLNRQGYTQAAWWNRIPHAAWLLMATMALVSTMLVGIGAHKARAGSALLVVLPAVISIAFFLIADIDSPRGGLIRVSPRNLDTLLQGMHLQK